ncbi:MAG: DUF4142 domain-containing protein [Chitinophagaceae bacterium]|nr:DUF4142 domain-containing protein [Chitinophagaceae bacterium]
MKKVMGLTAALGVVMFIMAGCNSGSEKEEAKTETATTTEATAPEQAAPALNDAQIASIAVTANQIDVDYGKIALEKSQNPEIRKFAETMIKDHSDIINQATALATKLNVTPEDNSTTQDLLKGQKDMNEKFAGLTGDAFDKAYAQNEAAYHDAVVNAVKTVLIPNTQNAELKSLIESVVPLLDHHLQMAKDLAAKFQ